MFLPLSCPKLKYMLRLIFEIQLMFFCCCLLLRALYFWSSFRFTTKLTENYRDFSCRPCHPISSVQSLSRVWLFMTPWTAACQASLSISNSQSLLKLLSIELSIQPSHPMSSPSPPTFNLFQHQGIFKWVISLHQVAKVLELQLQHQSFQWIFRTHLL